MSRYNTCKKTHQIADVNNIVSVLPYVLFIFFWYTIESKQLTLLKSAFILCYYYFDVLMRVNEDWAVGMKHVTVSSDVMRLVLKHRRRTKLVWNHLRIYIYKLTSDAYLKHIERFQSAAYRVYIRAQSWFTVKQKLYKSILYI